MLKPPGYEALLKPEDSGQKKEGRCV
jgi:hypothetical protein